VEQRPYIFCLVPPERADELLGPLRRHFANDPYVAVLVERRAEEPKARIAPAGEERHRRAPVAPRDLLRALPPSLQQETGNLRFVQRMEPLGRRHQQTPTRGLVAAIRAGDPEAASELWWRTNERVRSRLRTRLGDVAGARAEGGVLGRILDALDGYEEDGLPFSIWLDGVVDRYAAEQLAA
jgi:hypothetical protein